MTKRKKIWKRREPPGSAEEGEHSVDVARAGPGGGINLQERQWPQGPIWGRLYILEPWLSLLPGEWWASATGCYRKVILCPINEWSARLGSYYRAKEKRHNFLKSVFNKLRQEATVKSTASWPGLLRRTTRCQKRNVCHVPAEGQRHTYIFLVK